MKKIKFLDEPEDGFYLTLKQRVHNYFSANKISRFGNFFAYMKAGIFITAFISLYILILTASYMSVFPFLIIWFFMGMFMLFTAMSIVHDAAHNSFSPNTLVNKILLRFANIVGGDGYMYKYKHTVSHHPYTNIRGYDIDLEQSNMVKVTPYTKSKKKHKYQHLYMKLLYPGYILFWVLFRDFKYYQLEYVGPIKARHKRIHWLILFASKIFYFVYLLIIPALILPFSFWIILSGFFIMQIGSGVVAMFALLSNHVVEDSLFVVPDENGSIDCSWGEHQLRTTDDYSPDSKLISFFFSGLNHHVAHHLFPNYSHVHCPAITKIVRQTAAEFGLRYRYNSITGGLISHFKLLKNLSSEKVISTVA
jgi:linoleoyl-CoA desaturase